MSNEPLVILVWQCPLCDQSRYRLFTAEAGGLVVQALGADCQLPNLLSDLNLLFCKMGAIVILPTWQCC